VAAGDWEDRFEGSDTRTRVRVTLSFVFVDQMKQLIEMGFKEGFTMGLEQLAAMLVSVL